MRSLDYAAGAVRLHHDVDVPTSWLPAARTALLDGYFAVVEPTAKFVSAMEHAEIEGARPASMCASSIVLKMPNAG